jgi:hypothetical protein
MLLWSRLCTSDGAQSHAREALPLRRPSRKAQDEVSAGRAGGCSQLCAAAITQQATARGAGPSGAGRGWPTSVVTAKSVDGPQEVRRDRYWPHARRGPLKHHNSGSGNSEGGRQGGAGGKPAGGKAMVNDPLPSPGGWRKAGKCPPVPGPRGRLTPTRPVPTDSADDPQTSSTSTGSTMSCDVVDSVLWPDQLMDPHRRNFIPQSGLVV